MLKKTMRKGFTLVEMMIVIAIIAVLAGVAIPQYGKYVRKSETVEGIRFMKQIVDAQMLYQSTHNAYLAVTDIAGLTTLDVAIPTNAKFQNYNVDLCGTKGFIVTSSIGTTILTLANADNNSIQLAYPKASDGSTFIKNYADITDVAANEATCANGASIREPSITVAISPPILNS